jgi:hypothetical protein
MLLRVNEITIDPSNLRCNRITRDGFRCSHTAGDNSIVEIVSQDNGNGYMVIKLDVTCSTHVNTRAGDDVRFRVRMDAIDSSTLIDHNSGNSLVTIFDDLTR